MLRHLPLALAVLVLVLLLAAPQLFRPLFATVNPLGATAIYDRASLWSLTLDHLEIVLAAGLVSTIVAVLLGIVVTRRDGAEFMPFARTLTNLGQAFPPVAVLAIAVPLLGFGFRPTFVALFAYGLLPIFENTVAGLRSVPPQTIEAARGMGMSRGRILREVELPLAAPLILAGIRISTIINFGTATIGSTVGAKGLGEIIVAGLQSNNTAYILQGGVAVALLAILFDRIFAIAISRTSRHRAVPA
ncbi:ABC transporter permease [Faunimonas pinastri]|uniref:ABC transporter permease n=1 Tax=Faunimonas pinastri TaxID=1855383 RepID=UPI003D17932C